MGSASTMPGTSDIESRLFINGEFIAAKTASRMKICSPWDNSLVTSDIHVAEQEDIDTAVAAARTAFKTWGRTPGTTRQKALLRLADLIEQNIDEISRLEALCTGKPISQSKGLEVSMATGLIRYYAGWCDKLGGDSFPADNGFLKVIQREPIGVCAIVMAFNGPLIAFGMKAAPCLAAGNTLIIKTSEKSPLSVLYLGTLVQKAGFPPGVINIVAGGGSTGALLSSHMDVDKISFTGSVSTGKKIIQAAGASNLKRVTLELGGKSPSIVFPDANLEVAVQWCTMGITTNSGQACIASSRVYVHKDVKDRFVKQLKASFEQTNAAFGKDIFSEATQIGPLVDKAQFEKVSELVESGKAESTLITGGKALYEEGCWMAPTIFLDPKPNARVYKEEIFGPVVVVSEFESEDDVVERANATPFGLSGAVFSQDINRAMRVASKIESGTVCINCCGMLDQTAPFGGVKQSGWGKEFGKEGIEAYTQLKTVFVNMTY